MANESGDPRKFLTERGIEHVKLGVFDTDGILRGKYLNRDKILSGLNKHLGFCDVILGWDSNDQLYDNTKFTGWHTAYPDATVRILPETQREIPFEPKTALYLAEFSGRAEAVCPRNSLRRVLERAKGMGFQVSAAAEFEFFLFEETPQSIREKGYRQLKTMTPGNFGYSVLRNSVHSDFYHNLLDLSQAMSAIPHRGTAHRDRPRSHRSRAGAILRTRAGSGSDRAALFKTFTQGVGAAPRKLMATFGGQMVQSSSRSERSSSYFAAQGQRRQRFSRPREAARTCRTRCVGSWVDNRRSCPNYWPWSRAR